MKRLGNLSPPDFEDLCRDILQAETGQRFSAFGAGADGGVDGRHSKGPKSTILQCKHYLNSTFSQLKSALKVEVPKIDLLKPSRYIFVTSQSLTRARSDELAVVIGDRLKHPEDIWGAEDIEAALKRHPDIEKAHMKLWMTSTAVLEKVLQSGLEAHTEATKAEILDELRVYVRNPSFDAAFEKLEQHRVLVVSGPPGVGKTTLAKMLTYHSESPGPPRAARHRADLHRPRAPAIVTRQGRDRAADRPCPRGPGWLGRDRRGRTWRAGRDVVKGSGRGPAPPATD
ncbi:hypothetical protein BMG03_20445 (plasmid) [Thioclava nitratireducens]|uniref:Restriction endonuclease type IV Mrr domain-containing protein n=1 Tax=Thioclava nitratireducens TaxID=1915078 RepID=A0ABM6IMW4_9RHOB|nr:restriction endonuclease [Thioclava nitratireducens]AQS50272.1 hypothetical protein BMG03_20445 [Thioclava nitratireducens]